MVAYHSESGKLARLQFHRGPRLKIGQAVTFSIVDGAVDVLTADPAKEAVPKHESDAAGSAHTLVERTDDVAGPAASQAGAVRQALRAKRLQREIGRFHNAAAEEKLEWMDQTEAELQRLLEDGDGLCRLVQRMAAWLHRPVVRAATAQDPRFSDRRKAPDRISPSCRGEFAVR